jgi:hypothetical protein
MRIAARKLQLLTSTLVTHFYGRVLIEPTTVTHDRFGLDAAVLIITDTTYAYLRELGGERLVVLLNLGSEPVSVRIPAERATGAARFDTVFGAAVARVDERGLAIDLPGESATVVRALSQP